MLRDILNSDLGVMAGFVAIVWLLRPILMAMIANNARASEVLSNLRQSVDKLGEILKLDKDDMKEAVKENKQLVTEISEDISEIKRLVSSNGDLSAKLDALEARVISAITSIGKKDEKEIANEGQLVLQK